LVWAERTIVEPYQKLCEKLGYRDFVIEVDHFGTYNGIDFSSEYVKVLLIEGGAFTTNIAILDGGVVKYLSNIGEGIMDMVKRFSTRLDISPEEGMVLVRSEGFGGGYGDEYLRICDEIKTRIRRFLPSERKEELAATSRRRRRQRSRDGVSHILLAGGLAHIPGSDRYIGEKFSIETDMVELQNYEGKPLPSDEKYLYTTALGLALQGLD